MSFSPTITKCRIVISLPFVIIHKLGKTTKEGMGKGGRRRQKVYCDCCLWQGANLSYKVSIHIAAAYQTNAHFSFYIFYIYYLTCSTLPNQIHFSFLLMHKIQNSKFLKRMCTNCKMWRSKRKKEREKEGDKDKFRMLGPWSIQILFSVCSPFNLLKLLHLE